MSVNAIKNWEQKTKVLSKSLFVKANRERFFSVFRRVPQEMFSSPVSVACSGGADSLCLFLLVWKSFPELRNRLVVLHYDHAVRVESASDAEFVRKICEELGVVFRVERREPCSVADVNLHASENALRQLRLDFFSREMRATDSQILIQGHQLDDVAESLLMRLTRGAGTDGLASPRQISRQSDGRFFLRPLLNFSKKEIVSALEKAGISWREDSTNAGTDYFRNRVRNTVLPALCESAPFRNFARSRMLAEEDSDALNFFADKIFFEKTSSDKGAREFRIFDKDENFRIFPALVRRVLWKIFAQEKIKTPARAAEMDCLVFAICAGTSQRVVFGENEIFWNGAGTLRVSTARTVKNAEANVAFRVAFEPLEFPFPRAARADSSATEIFSVELAHAVVATAEIVPLFFEIFDQIFSGKISPKNEVFLSLENWCGEKIFLREKKTGEKFRPLGSSGKKKISDIFTDKKIPQMLRANLPVFADAKGVAWIPCLPPAERFRLNGTEKMALRLTYRSDALPL